MLIGIIVVVVIVAVVLYRANASTAALLEKPSHLRQPIERGRFRVVGHDEVPGGDELTNVIGDYATWEEALKEAQTQRADSELRVGHKGQPTRFMIYNDKGELTGDWNGRK